MGISHIDFHQYPSADHSSGSPTDRSFNLFHLFGDLCAIRGPNSIFILDHSQYLFSLSSGDLRRQSDRILDLLRNRRPSWLRADTIASGETDSDRCYAGLLRMFNNCINIYSGVEYDQGTETSLRLYLHYPLTYPSSFHRSRNSFSTSLLSITVMSLVARTNRHTNEILLPLGYPHSSPSSTVCYCKLSSAWWRRFGEIMSAVNLSRAGIIIRNSQWSSSFIPFLFVPSAIFCADPIEKNVYMEIKQQANEYDV